MKNVAFFFSSISTKSLKKEQSRKKAHAEEEGSDDADDFLDSSQSKSQRVPKKSQNVLTKYFTSQK